jgi:hypothetical protein
MNNADFTYEKLLKIIRDSVWYQIQQNQIQQDPRLPRNQIQHGIKLKNSNPARSECSLSLWRVVRGSKLMHLDLIHGLFIT